MGSLHTLSKGAIHNGEVTAVAGEFVLGVQPEVISSQENVHFLRRTLNVFDSKLRENLMENLLIQLVVGIPQREGTT